MSLTRCTWLVNGRSETEAEVLKFCSVELLIYLCDKGFIFPWLSKEVPLTAAGWSDAGAGQAKTAPQSTRSDLSHLEVFLGAEEKQQIVTFTKK